jgi:hypothetical protein
VAAYSRLMELRHARTGSRRIPGNWLSQGWQARAGCKEFRQRPRG